MATTNLSPLLLLHSHSSSLSISKHKHRIRSSSLRCSASSNGSGPADKESERRQLEEKRRAELAARIASGEFTVQESGWVSFVRNLQGLFSNLTGESGTKKGQQIPKARGSISSVGGQAFFLPLYELFLTYGGIFRLIFGPKSFLIVSDPAIAKHILRDNSKAYSKGILAEILDFVMGTGLIPADGEIWRVRRRAIVPALHQKYVAAMISLFGNASFRLCEKLNKAAQEGENAEMESLFSRLTLDVIGKAVFNYNFDSLTYEAALSIFRQSWKEAFQNRIIMYVAAMISLFGNASFRLCEKLDKAAQEGEDVEMESLFSRLTLDVIGKAVFNYDFDSLTYDNGIVEAVYTVLREAEMRSTSPIPVWEIPIWKDISPRQRKVNQALKLINDILDELIAICKRMVDQEDLQFHEEYMNEQDPSILHFLLASGDDVSSKQLRDDLMTMLIAGHETSAAVLTWTFYLLSKDPQVVAKLQEEADTVIGDRFPTIDDMKKLKYTTRVINESLRLYPQPPVLIRRSIEDDVLGGYPIGRGEDIFISIWNLHRCPKNWTDADKFNPERWPLDGPNPNETNQNFSYLPFGGGPRKCVGDMFATFEVVVATAMLMRRFNFQMAPNAPPVEMTTGATIHTTEGLNMTVTHRTRPVIIPNLEAKIISDDRCDGSDLSASQEDQVTAQI